MKSIWLTVLLGVYVARSEFDPKVTIASDCFLVGHFGQNNFARLGSAPSQEARRTMLGTEYSLAGNSRSPLVRTIIPSGPAQAFILYLERASYP